MPNPHSVGANSSSGNDTMPFGMAGGSSVVGSLADFPTLGSGVPIQARNTPSSELMAPILGSLGQDFKMADSDFPSLAPAKKLPAEQRASQQVAAPGDLTEGMLGGMAGSQSRVVGLVRSRLHSRPRRVVANHRGGCSDFSM